MEKEKNKSRIITWCKHCYHVISCVLVNGEADQHKHEECSRCVKKYSAKPKTNENKIHCHLHKTCPHENCTLKCEHYEDHEHSE